LVRKTSVLLAAMGCTGDPPPDALRGPQAPSVLIITLDTTRADRLGPYDYPLADTPIYDKLAAEGTVFRAATATSPLTIPSHSTILTGKVPPSHGVRDNGDFVLGEDQVLLSERLQAAGWSTAAFTSAFPTQARWGFDQGFDVYHDPLARLPTQLDWRDERRAGEVIDDALQTLEDFEGPVFAWVHLFDAHWPYEPPSPFDVEHLGRPYDGEIAYTAHEVGRLMEWWDARHPTSLTIITSDHGEGMGDGGEQTHGFLLHDGTIRVPLILRGRGLGDAVAVGADRRESVGHADIVPTVLNIVGLPLDDELQGVDLRDGGSPFSYSEALTGQFNLGLAPLYSVTDDEGRYTEGAWGAFYPRLADRVLTMEDGTVPLRPYAERLDTFQGAIDETIAPSAALDAEAMEQLMALGYMGGDTSAEAGDVDPRDVIDIVPLTWQVRQAMGAGRLRIASAMLDELEARMPGTWGVEHLRARLLQAQGRPVEALHRYIDLFHRSPSSTVALQVAGLQASSGDWVEAESWFREALELQPASPEAMGGIVRSLMQQGELPLARELADQYLALYPDHAELALTRAELFLADGRIEDAWTEADYALQRMPRSPWAHATAAQVQWARGEADESIVLLQEALRLDPYQLPMRVRLVNQLLEVGRNAEAVRTIAPAARLLPDEPAIQELAGAARAALDDELGRAKTEP